MKKLFTAILIFFSANVLAQTNTKDTILKDPTLKIEIRNKILTDSKDGGPLDFWTPIKGHEYDGELIQKDPNIIATKREIAVIKWAFVLTKNGIKKKVIISIYEELKGRKIREDEIQLIDMGIKKAAG